MATAIPDLQYHVHIMAEGTPGTKENPVIGTTSATRVISCDFEPLDKFIKRTGRTPYGGGLALLKPRMGWVVKTKVALSDFSDLTDATTNQQAALWGSCRGALSTATTPNRVIWTPRQGFDTSAGPKPISITKDMPGGDRYQAHGCVSRLVSISGERTSEDGGEVIAEFESFGWWNDPVASAITYANVVYTVADTEALLPFVTKRVTLTHGVAGSGGLSNLRKWLFTPGDDLTARVNSANSNGNGYGFAMTTQADYPKFAFSCDDLSEAAGGFQIWTESLSSLGNTVSLAITDGTSTFTIASASSAGQYDLPVEAPDGGARGYDLECYFKSLTAAPWTGTWS